MAEEQKTHTHVLEDGTVVEHSHGEHGHHHSHAHTKAVLNRMSRAIGHMESIKRMIEDGRDCAEVLIQLSAVKHTPLSREVFWHEYAKIPRHTSQNSIAVGNLE